MSSRGRPAAGVHGDVLDIGCGFGDNAVYLAKNGHTVTGLDISPTALKTAERRAKDAGVHVMFAVADSTKLDGYTDAFDAVIDSVVTMPTPTIGRTRSHTSQSSRVAHVRVDIIRSNSAPERNTFRKLVFEVVDTETSAG
jgi:SAM-dependent methyltransferase